MSVMQYMKRFVTNPKVRFGYLSKLGFYDRLSDTDFLKKKFRVMCGTEPDLVCPQTFNEKMQFLKLHDRNPAYTQMVDKYAVKEYVARQTDQVHVFTPLGVWDRFEDIPFETLPESFVLKCTHDSGSVVFCRDKRRFDQKAAGKKLRRALKQNYFYIGREWPYKNVKPRIMAETLFSDESGYELKDYKVFVFHGRPRLIEVDFNRFGEEGHHRNLYTPEWEFLEAEIEYPSDRNRVFDKPVFLETMLEAASELAGSIPFVRVDFYHTGEALYFGEFTFYHDGGTGEFRPAAFGKQMGNWIDHKKAYAFTESGEA
ncbi:MAG: glycosyl transferase [Lachnospiraceae bacterium]|nr:glycosyl transferase [Lachnospiraceae bacterium]